MGASCPWYVRVIRGREDVVRVNAAHEDEARAAAREEYPDVMTVLDCNISPPEDHEDYEPA